MSYQNWTNKLNYTDHLDARQHSDAGFNKFGKILSVKNAMGQFPLGQISEYCTIDWEN